MSGRWAFTDMEFALICDREGHGAVPEPFTFTSRIPLAEDYAAERRRVLAELRARGDSELAVLAEAIARPDVSLAIHAWDEADFAAHEQHVRVHAVRSRARGYVITQRPGETLWHSGGFDVAECDPHAVAEVALGCLPFANAGRSLEIPLPDADAEPDRGSSPIGPSIGDEAADADAERGAAFLATRAERAGDLQLFQGRSKFGPRGRVGMRLEWRDLPGDGRYVIRRNAHMRVATGMGTKAMVEWVDEQVAEILLRLDRHMENEE
ncbi:ESX secretion-associated protein EspG [Nocardia asteroides]|uniref:ESX secretion-associated protein EspG n=1 Tax=Nocardia asteroides TaxID=1824 RepID=UPI001E4523D3|nr:ESX secretion-associated protein EspG [Nocardia asteroides]UGT60567.1 ESX secretion-associated protein EspG [Nocardia asteroides]